MEKNRKENYEYVTMDGKWEGQYKVLEGRTEIDEVESGQKEGNWSWNFRIGKKTVQTKTVLRNLFKKP